MTLFVYIVLCVVCLTLATALGRAKKEVRFFQEREEKQQEIDYEEIASRDLELQDTKNLVEYWKAMYEKRRKEAAQRQQFYDEEKARFAAIIKTLERKLVGLQRLKADVKKARACLPTAEDLDKQGL